MTDKILSARNDRAATSPPPAQPTVAPAQTPSILAFPTGVSRRRMRVLVVNPTQRQAFAIAQMLDMLGYDSATAHDVAEAAEHIAQFKPHEVVWDIEAPGLERRRAFEALRRLLVDSEARRVAS